MIPTTGINLIPQEVRNGNTFIDERWKQFSDEELTMLSDFVFHYESGETTQETCHRLVRGLMTEIFRRKNEYGREHKK